MREKGDIYNIVSCDDKHNYLHVKDCLLHISIVEQLSLKNTWLCALNDKSMKLCKYFLYIIKLFFGHRTTFNLTFGDL